MNIVIPQENEVKPLFESTEALNAWKQALNDAKTDNEKELASKWITHYENELATTTEAHNKQEDVNYSNFLTMPSKQFKLDCGAIMAPINNEEMKFHKISLFVHARDTYNFEQFIDSIKTFLKSIEKDVSAEDIIRLKAHYEKYYIK